tara:strand:+ start:318 stop:650 length:333 start_codon:yes stop_codon:yes gene_type:complete
MSSLEIVLSLILLVSVILNIGIFLYARNVVVKLLSVSEELGDFKEIIDSFAAHTETVYEMEMFYGDETLGALMEHARSLNEQLETFEYIYSLTEQDIPNDENEEPEAENP